MAATVSKTLLASLALAGLSTSAPAPSLEPRGAMPSYVLQYAPLIWLDSGDSYFPSPVDGFLNYTTPKVNNVTVVDAPSPLTLSNLADLNSKGGTNVALCSNDDFTKYPPWLNGSKPDGSHKTAGDPSAAIIVNDKGNNTVIAFYMYFYNFNQGNDVLGTPAGNHLGDWEHNAIWFKDGKPQSVWYSQHSDGEAFTYSATQKSGQRPLSYSARGSHANYAKSGTHDHTIPGVNLPVGIGLKDYTSQGTLWDPTLNAYTYAYDEGANAFTAYNGADPTSWLTYQGTWGDPTLPSSDPRQHEDFGIAASAEWTGGPTGPDDKKLDRGQICPTTPCIIRPILTAK